MKIQYLIKKIPCLDFWNHMVSKAKHLCKKIISVSKVWKRRKKTQPLERVLIGKEIKLPGKCL